MKAFALRPVSRVCTSELDTTLTVSVQVESTDLDSDLAFSWSGHGCHSVREDEIVSFSLASDCIRLSGILLQRCWRRLCVSNTGSILERPISCTANTVHLVIHVDITSATKASHYVRAAEHIGVEGFR